MEDLDKAYISYNIGNLFYDFEKLEEALSYYNNALYIYPDFTNAWKNKGLILFTMGRLQSAAACYNQIFNLDPKYPGLWVDIGMIFFEIGTFISVLVFLMDFITFQKEQELLPFLLSFQ